MGVFPRISMLFWAAALLCGSACSATNEQSCVSLSQCYDRNRPCEEFLKPAEEVLKQASGTSSKQDLVWWRIEAIALEDRTTEGGSRAKIVDFAHRNLMLDAYSLYWGDRILERYDVDYLRSKNRREVVERALKLAESGDEMSVLLRRRFGLIKKAWR